MANIVDPKNLPAQKIQIPGHRPVVRDFKPNDHGDPAEVDAFNKMIRELRNQSPAEPTISE